MLTRVDGPRGGGTLTGHITILDFLARSASSFTRRGVVLARGPFKSSTDSRPGAGAGAPGGLRSSSVEGALARQESFEGLALRTRGVNPDGRESAMPIGGPAPTVRNVRSRRSRPFGALGLLGTVLAVVVTAAPTGALALVPGYHPDCTGRLTGSSTSTDGINQVTSWSLNLSQGTFALPYEYSRTNSTHVTPFVHTAAWISVGPGPKSGTCLTPNHRWVVVRYSFVNLDYSVRLRANCSSSTVGANAAYNISLEANLYDASKASNVWRTNLTHMLGHRTIG